MKKIAFLLALLMFVLPITANAAAPRSVFIKPGISFNGNTANCTVLSVFLALVSCSKMFLTRADTVFRFSKCKPPLLIGIDDYKFITCL